MRSPRYIFVSLLFLTACGGGPAASVPDGGTSPCVGSQKQFGSVCLTPPTMAAVRTPCGDVTEFCDPTNVPTPNFDCLSAAPKQHPATPATVTLVGYAHPFASGSTPSGVTITLFKAADLLAGADPATATPVTAPVTLTFDPAHAGDGSNLRACDDDSKVGCVATVPNACVAPTCDDGLNGHAVGNNYCHLVKGGGPVCSPRLRWEPRFSIPNVPTNTQLVMRTAESDGKATSWAVMDSWNVFLASDDKACTDALSSDCLDLSDKANPKYQLNANLLSSGDYSNIPNVAGLSQGIAQGRGAVAGEIHDCDNVRVGFVQVGVNPPGDRFTYFNGDPYKTVPDSSRSTSGTDRLGLFSSLNTRPGPVSVEGAALVNGKIVSVGKLKAVLFPDSVAVLNVNGGKPQQQ